MYSLLFLVVVLVDAVWCRRTDELVDGPNASHITPTALDRWESRLEDIFRGRPFDMLDAALSDTVTKFPVDIQVWQSLIFIFIFKFMIYIYHLMDLHSQ